MQRSHPRVSVLTWLTLSALAISWWLTTSAIAHDGEPAGRSTAPVSGVASASATAPRVSVVGDLERMHGHRHRTRAPVAGWLLTTAKGRRIPVELAPGLRARAGTRVRVSGARHGAVLRASSLRRMSGGVTARASALPVGAKKTAVILFNFSDDRSEPFTQEQVRSALFTGPRSVSAFYAAESHGRLTLTGHDRPDGDVLGWFPIDSSAAECFGGKNWDWYEKADAAVRATGVDLSAYEHVVYVHPKVASCQFAGIATLGGNWSSLNGTLGLWVAGHEIGHNYRFEHAGRAFCKDQHGLPVSVSDSCTVAEYDDPYDIMGNRFQRHSSGIRQLQAGWIPSANLRTVTTSSTHVLAPLAEQTSAVQVLRIPRPDGRSYWLEFRRPHGAFDDFALSEPVVSGVTIRLAGSLSDPGVSELIDTNPTTSRSARDEALGVGRTFVDAANRITVTTEAAGPEGARVTVGVDVTPPAATPPPASPPASVSAPASAPAPATPAPAVTARRITADRASSGARRLPAQRVASADGRTLTVGARRSPATLDLRYRPGSAAGRLRSRIELRLRAPRACLAVVSLRADGRAFSRVASVSARRQWSDVAVVVPRRALGSTTHMRIACAGGARTLTLDTATLSMR